MTSAPSIRWRLVSRSAVLAAALVAVIVPATAGHAATVAAQRAAARTTAAPPGRWRLGLAYDPAQGDVVLFGGENNSRDFGDTWTWANGAWTRQHPALSPAARSGAALVYDTASQQLVLFGGRTSAPGQPLVFQNDTWIWTGSTWQQLHPATSPPARYDAALAYDAATGEVVLYGGWDGTWLGDTWTWNGTTWTQQTPATSPGPLETSLAYDSARQQVIMDGGWNGVTAFTYTWSWNGSTWTRLSTPASPGRVPPGNQIAGDPATGQVLQFGGGRRNHTNSRMTFAWNGTTWTHLTPAQSPAGRGGGSMTYDAATGQILLYGGTGYHQHNYTTTTWAWTGTTWQRIT